MPARVVSLIPSVTETLLAWGVVPIACTRFCEQPDLRHVGGTKDPDVAAIVELAPDLVVVDDEENRREDADALVAAGVALHVTSVHSVADVGPVLRDLAGAIGADASRDLAALAEAAARPDRPATRRRAFVPIWRRPWMALGADTYGTSVLDALGVDNVAATAGVRYPELDLDAARALGPDIVIAPSEPYPFAARHVPELSSVAPVVLVDGRDLFWWGTRTAGALVRLAAVATPA